MSVKNRDFIIFHIYTIMNIIITVMMSLLGLELVKLYFLFVILFNVPNIIIYLNCFVIMVNIGLFTYLMYDVYGGIINETV